MKISCRVHSEITPYQQRMKLGRINTWCGLYGEETRICFLLGSELEFSFLQSTAYHLSTGLVTISE
jgi:hypothetical protein